MPPKGPPGAGSNERPLNASLRSKLIRNADAWVLSWTICLNVGMVGGGAALSMLGPTLNSFADQIGISFVSAGSLFTVRGIAYMLGALYCGVFLEHGTMRVSRQRRHTTLTNLTSLPNSIVRSLGTPPPSPRGSNEETYCERLLAQERAARRLEDEEPPLSERVKAFCMHHYVEPLKAFVVRRRERRRGSGLFFSSCFKNVTCVFFLPLMVACVSTFYMPSCTSLIGALCIVFAHGLAIGVLDSGGNVVLLRLWLDTRPAKLETHMHLYHFSFAIGSLASPLMVGWLVSNSSYYSVSPPTSSSVHAYAYASRSIDSPLAPVNYGSVNVWQRAGGIDHGVHIPLNDERHYNIPTASVVLHQPDGVKWGGFDEEVGSMMYAWYLPTILLAASALGFLALLKTPLLDMSSYSQDGDATSNNRGGNGNGGNGGGVFFDDILDGSGPPQPQLSRISTSFMHALVLRWNERWRRNYTIIVLLGLFLLLYIGLEVAYSGYATQFTLWFVPGTTMKEASQMASFFWLGLCLGRVTTPLVCPRFINLVPHLGYSLVLAACSMFALTGSSYTNMDTVSTEMLTWVMVIASIIYGFALAPLFPGAILVAESKLENQSLTGKTAGATIFAASLGEMIIPFASGALLDAFPPYFVYFQGLLCVAAFIVFYAMKKI